MSTNESRGYDDLEPNPDEDEDDSELDDEFAGGDSELDEEDDFDDEFDIDDGEIGWGRPDMIAQWREEHAIRQREGRRARG